MFCANCACELPAVAKFCVRCGSEVAPSTSSTKLTSPPVLESVGTPSLQCSQCHSDNPNDYSFCAACGESLKPVVSPLFLSNSNTITAFSTVTLAAKSAPHQAIEPQQHQQEVQRPRGVGGWLLLFCIGLIVFSPLYNAVEILDNPNDMFVIVFDLVLSAFSICTGIMIWRVRPIGLKLVKVYFIIMIVVACLAILGSFSTDSKEASGHSTPPVLVGLRALIYVAIWWSYFVKSERVKATFGSHL